MNSQRGRRQSTSSYKQVAKYFWRQAIRLVALRTKAEGVTAREEVDKPSTSHG